MSQPDKPKFEWPKTRKGWIGLGVLVVVVAALAIWAQSNGWDIRPPD